MTPADDSPFTGDVEVTFFDNFVPTLLDGQYTIQVSQALAVDTEQTQKDQGNTGIPPAPQAPATQSFIVRGPRFALDPADVQSVFPPQNATGDYDQYLPMIVFNKRSLPWERRLPNAVAGAPWLALLVLTPDQLLPPEPAVGSATSQPAGSQANPTCVASFPLDNVVNAQFNGQNTTGPPSGILGPSITLQADEDPATTFCNVIDILADTFAQLTPALEDLPYLTHVRQVTTDNKVAQSTAQDGWFSTIIGNRFGVPPVPNATDPQPNIAHLVSLEGLETYLGTTPSGCQRVRLISLYSWKFSCQADPQENFRSMMLNLIANATTGGADLLLRLSLPPGAAPSGDAETAAAGRLSNGYVPLSYATRTGEQTFAWYRGPLSPVPTQEFLETTGPASAVNPAAPTNASEAMIYDPTTGLFDQSYAVAFQTGRSLALASLPFATNLLQWRREAHAVVDLLMENLRSPHLASSLQTEGILDQNLNLTGAGVQDLAELLDADIVSNAFTAYLATEFADGIAERIGEAGGYTPQDAQQTPPNPSTTQPVVPSDLSALMQDPAVVSLLRQLSGLEAPENGSEVFEAALMPDQIVQWLAQTSLLYSVPFNNLVPNSAMLPPESIRFFYIDQNWIDSLLAGALSAGAQTSRDALFNELMREPLGRAAADALAEVRDQLRSVATGQTPPPLGSMAGFLLRSGVVSDCPGLEVRAWSGADPVNPMKPLRLDRISPTVMIGIFPDVPVRLEFNQPSEGLVFGFEDEGVELRYIPGVSGATASNLGAVINPTTPIFLQPADIQTAQRPQPAGRQPALNFAGSGGIVQLLAAKFGSAPPVLTPASFALQMVRVPEQMLFERQNGGSQ